MGSLADANWNRILASLHQFNLLEEPNLMFVNAVLASVVTPVLSAPDAFSVSSSRDKKTMPKAWLAGLGRQCGG
jgi:hypothetical protein